MFWSRTVLVDFLTSVIRTGLFRLPLLVMFRMIWPGMVLILGFMTFCMIWTAGRLVPVPFRTHRTVGPVHVR